MPYKISDERRAEYRRTSIASGARRRRALIERAYDPVHPINRPRLVPAKLMPTLPRNGLTSLSLFSGGGGLDLGFERAGFDHLASYEIPCQPFSIAGKRGGEDDTRNMWPEFLRAVRTIKPRAFVAENVPGLLQPKFSDFVERFIREPLSKDVDGSLGEAQDLAERRPGRQGVREPLSC